MKIFASASAAVLAASAVVGSVDASLMDYLRGSASSVYDHSVESYVGQFACTLSGGTDQSTCDASKSEDGSKCVWCDIATFGVCVSEDIAEKMKEQIPGLECDDDNSTDDDKTDDATPTDDDVKPSDDAVSPDYWECLEKNDNETACEGAGCTWCDTKGGFGICMDKAAAADASDSDWYTCKTENLKDPADPSCVLVTLQGDESQCKQTSDADGNPCEWCSISSYEVCLNADQAAFAEQAGGSCNTAAEVEEDEVEDPYDPTCLAATLSGDEKTCQETLDSEGNGCLWCSIGTTDLCVNAEQAMFAQQFGGSCDDMVAVDDKEEEENEEDPYDPSCVLINIQGADEDACHATEDSEGNKCQWCTIGTTSVCVNTDQAAAAEQLGGMCDESKNQQHTATRSGIFSIW
eukprot:CAMPEP_0113446210 /NCGR_PEP_ID=MMETSP0014_2-20120614/3586_1 /TAXON_ID=2857 /ORGANISM="Nitzschia sp." /LENGTH=405 /DNA_ID=CAMNT_0000337289 /DNA_START=553 /DNA_END=1770 /DNA_ORIENTATION=+ /assembly_acc=CAM_ASM_000159